MDSENEKIRKNIKQLVSLIVTEEFGPQSDWLIGILYENPESTLEQLIALSESQCRAQSQAKPKPGSEQDAQPKLTESQIKDLVVVLMKNNFITFQKQGNSILYSVNGSYIIGYLRHTIYINNTKMLFGINAGLIIEYVLNNSICTFTECARNLDQKLLYQTELRKLFIQLINHNYLIREEISDRQEERPAPEIKTYEFEGLVDQVQFEKTDAVKAGKDAGEELPAEKKSTMKKKRSPSQNEEDALEDVARAPGKGSSNARKGKKKLKTQDDSGLQKELELKQLEQKQLEQKALKSKQQEEQKAQQQKEMEDSVLFDRTSGQEFCFRINHRQFLHDMRTAEICKCVEGKINILGKFIIKAMLDSSSRVGHSKTFNCSEFLTLEEIKKLLPAEFRQLQNKEIQDSLLQLNQDNVQFVVEQLSDAHLEKYAVQVAKIIRAIQFIHITKIMERRYSSLAAKIIRVLKKYKTIEDQKLNEMFLENIKDVRKWLSQLVKDGIVSYTEMKENERSGAVLQLYSYEKHRLIDFVIDHTFQAICNVYIRLNEEYKNFQTIQANPQKVELKQSQDDCVKLIQTYQINLLELDSSLLLFTEF